MKSIYLYDDEIGRVDLIDHMGTDLTIVNSARVSFGVTKNELETRDKKLIKYLVDHRHTSIFVRFHCMTMFYVSCAESEQT